MKHRRWNRFRAEVGRYFWLPCPVCGEWFGGHEFKGEAIHPYEDTPTTGVGICPDCAAAGRGDETVPVPQEDGSVKWVVYRGDRPDPAPYLAWLDEVRSR